MRFSSVILSITFTVLVLDKTPTVRAQYSWEQWGSWGSCSLPCGGGTRTRRRHCLTEWVSPCGNGKPCRRRRYVPSSCDMTPESQNVQTEPCQTQACPVVVNGAWGSWGSYGPCSKTCGNGTTTRTRTCNNPAPAYGGADCAGSISETATCKLQECPVNGQWGSWGSYGSCSVTCGDGTKTRTRTCDNPTPAYGGAGCAGSNSETAACKLQECPVHGQWGSWGSYGSCSKTCGDGTITRTRTCNNPTPAYGGADCSGSNSETATCKLQECPVMGQWGAWGSYGPCSKTCEDGTTTRTRTCDNPAPAYGGADCEGRSYEIEICTSLECATETQLTNGLPVAAIAGGAASAGVVVVVAVVVVIVIVLVRRRRRSNESDGVVEKSVGGVEFCAGQGSEESVYSEIGESEGDADHPKTSAPKLPTVVREAYLTAVHVDHEDKKAQYYNTGKGSSKAAASSAGVYEDVGYPSSSVYDKANVYENRKEERVYTKLRKT